jgi:hypothetical protein
MNVTVSPTHVAPVTTYATIDPSVNVTRHAHTLTYHTGITGKICDICRQRLGNGYQCNK